MCESVDNGQPFRVLNHTTRKGHCHPYAFRFIQPISTIQQPELVSSLLKSNSAVSYVCMNTETTCPGLTRQCSLVRTLTAHIRLGLYGSAQVSHICIKLSRCVKKTNDCQKKSHCLRVKEENIPSNHRLKKIFRARSNILRRNGFYHFSLLRRINPEKYLKPLKRQEKNASENVVC